jgi:hypothetical protein
MAQIDQSKETSQDKTGASQQTSRADEYRQANMSTADRGQMRSAIAASVVPSAANEVPIKNRAIVNYAYKALGADSNYNFAREEVMKRFGVDLSKAESDRQGVSSIKLTKENGAQVHILLERFKGVASSEPAQVASQQLTSKIPRAIQLEEVPNQKLINYAYNVLKVEQRGVVAERQLKATFGVELDSLIANSRGTSTIEVKKGPGGNETALQQALNPSTARPSVASEPQSKRNDPSTTGRADLKSEKAKAEQVQSVTGKDIARLYEKTADALTDLLGGGRAGRAAAATFLGAKGTSDRALEEAIAQKVGSRYIATGYDPVSLRGQYRNSQFGVDRYHIGEMTQDLQKLLNTAVKQRDAAAHAPAHAKTEQREHEKPQPERNLGREEFIAKTVIEPGRGLFKRVRDTITDMQGNTVIATERSRMNLGSWSFNVPGTRYNVSNGVPEDQAKALAKKHIQDVSRRN